MALPQPSRLIYATAVRRSAYFWRALITLVAAFASFAAAWALLEAGRRSLADSRLLDVGALLAILLGGWFVVRVAFNLARWLGRSGADIRVYNQGIVWRVGRDEHKYRWKQLLTYREGMRGWYWFGRPVIVWGANTLTFLDDDNRAQTRLRFRSAYGNPRDFALAVSPYAAYVTSLRIGAALRRDEPVRLHPKLALYPRGVEAGRVEIHWEDLSASMKGRRLIVRRRDPSGKLRTAARYPLHAVDNVGGFLDVASSMSRPHQPAPAARRQTAGPPLISAPLDGTR